MVPLTLLGFATATVGVAAYKTIKSYSSETIDPAIESIKAAMDTLTIQNQKGISQFIDVSIKALNKEQKATHELALRKLLKKKIEGLSHESVHISSSKENIKMESLLKQVFCGVEEIEFTTEGIFRKEADESNKIIARDLYNDGSIENLVVFLKELPIIERCSVIKNLINSFLDASIDFNIQRSLADFLYKVVKNSGTNHMTESNLKIAFPACNSLNFSEDK